ncbi:D-alanine-D-alanine ligase [Terribacillus halophilus]|uniref:D-alanine--D-alanine ligase n=1 Tax=Terribacillus halophilus TaxID=361279 RepID=A0A1G6RTK6_9BACI|nr:D-alanine--D-alanine ligase [Terribacillus halophilus]SDD07317.1 D-alanine-D-alanine ligase [Terribacillus halophilus]
MGKTKVGIVFGGKSAEHEVSLQSAKNIADAIDKNKYDVVLIGIDKEGKWQLNDKADYLLNANDPKLIELKPSKQGIAVVPGVKEQQLVSPSQGSVLDQVDVIFSILHGTLGEDGSMQGMLRIANLPYVGPNVLSSAVCMDKDIAKRLLKEAGIRVANGFTFKKRQLGSIKYEEVAKVLGSTVFIKPANQGSSVGVSKAKTEEEFYKGLEEAFRYDTKVLVEEAIAGREIEVAVLGNEEPMASLPGEILPKTEFYSYESKYIDESGAELAIPAQLSESVTVQARKLAVEVFQTLDVEGLARVDFFLTEDGEFVVNEVNTLPGFTKISMYPKLWDITGISYSDLIDRLIQLAIERHKRDNELSSAAFEQF